MLDSLPPASRRYRFGAFEADADTGELRRQGIRIKLNAQSFQALCLLLSRPGELLSRDEIARQLWPDGTFVDFDHGVNSAINRIREALGDTASSPRFLETLARRGYRFIAPVERIPAAPAPIPGPQPDRPQLPSHMRPGGAIQPAPRAAIPSAPDRIPFAAILASPHELPRAPHRLVHTLLLLFQIMYLGFYIGALANLPEIDDLLAPLPHAPDIYLALIVSAAILIPVRAFLLSLVSFRAPRARTQFLRLWPFLLAADELWSLAPFLLLHHITFGLALACTALLVYSPFAQRSLVLMGAGHPFRALSHRKQTSDIGEHP